MFASLAAAVLILVYQSPAMVRSLLLNLVIFISHASESTLLGSAHIRMVSLNMVGTILPVMGATVFAGAVAVLLQTKFLLNLGGLQPKFSRVSPFAGFKRIFGFNGVVEMVKSIGKLGLFATAIWFAIRGDMRQLARLPWQDPHGMLSTVARPVYHLLIAGLCTQGVVAGADLMWVRFRHTRDMRMSQPGHSR